ncbi:MAG: alginate export family protein [Pseudomonadota bacterium]|nr:alginate export family protein [Pseudomonadota bacterium]
MVNGTKTTALTATAMVSMLALDQASANALTDAINGGTPNVDYRIRAEMVEQDGFTEDAEAFTQRLRLGYRTGSVGGFMGFVEFEHVDALGAEKYNSTQNGKTEFPVVADPEGTEVNQVYLDYAGVPDTLFRLGRQRLILDNARFVGNVGWRQNEQTFNAVKVENKSLTNTVLSYSYLDKSNTILFGEVDLEGHLVNATVKPVDWASITAYGYFLDFEVDTGPTKDTKTFGLRVTGGVPLGQDVKLNYTAEYADQSDYADATDIVDADYYWVGVGVTFANVLFSVDQEVLSGDGTYNFQTPLATKHAFNGWADKFLGDLIAGGDGLVDTMVKAQVTVSGFKFMAVYHDFSGDESGDDFGTELDLLISKSFTPNLSGLVKYADYDADTFATDTRKFWVMANYKF